MPAQPRPVPSRSPVLRRLTALGAAVCAMVGGPLAAQTPPPRDPSPHSDAVLVSEQAAVRPGDTLSVAVRLTLDAGWHTYWINPGDAGLPLRVRWTLPADVTAGPLQFPTPRLTPQPPLMSYGYESEVFVLAKVAVPASATIGSTLTLTAKAEWLACAEVCLPATAPLSLTVPVTAAGGGTTTWTAALERTRVQLPTAAPAWQLRAWSSDAGYTVMLVTDASRSGSLVAPYFFVDSTGIVEHAQAQQVARAGDTLVMQLPRATLSSGTATQLAGIITSDIAAADPRSVAVTIPISAKPPAAWRSAAAAMLADSSSRAIGGVGSVAPAIGATSTVPDPGADLTLVAALGFAFLGGLLLNLMPCVFPVLSVKVLALLEHGGAADPARGRRHGLAFGAGVLVSFWLLAGVLLALRAGGETLGWGFQLQSPLVVGLLALLMFALGLNLSGVFEIGLTLTRLGSAGAGGGYGDSLLTGALAVVVAAPCTAPFMGAALGFALVQPAIIGLLVFTALGIGLALPFVVLASAPSLLRFLPRPGPWLETMKQAFAFPLYATVVWLLWVFGQQAGVDALAVVLLAMIVLALGAWLWARGVRSGAAPTRAVAAALMVFAIGVTGLGASRATPPSAAPVVAAGWEPWSEARVQALRTEGRAVFVDFTAAWCLSCQVNERVALRTASVQRAFASGNVALLRADWTSRDSAITNVLAGFGRSGVPLYVLYPAGAGNATLLPAVLTPGMVVDAVRKAAPTAVASGVR